MFKPFAARSQTADRINLTSKNRKAAPTPRLIITAALLSLAPVAVLLAVDPAAAASATLCGRAHKACISDCKTSAPFEFRKACVERCAADFNLCVGVVIAPAPEPFHFWRWKHHKHRHHDDPKDPPKPPKPPKPPRTENHTPPTGGTKPDPKPRPPKVNDTRPPMGGGVVQPKTSGTGNNASTSGASGPTSGNGRH